MFTSRSSLFFVVIGGLSLSQAADPPANPPPAIPECAARCMSIKITEAAKWFGPGDVRSYCQHHEFLLAYNTCVQDNCPPDHQDVGIQAGKTACAGVLSPAQPVGTNASAPAGTNPSPSGPVAAPGSSNSTLVPLHPGVNPANTSSSLNSPTPTTPTNTSGLNGALPSPPPSVTNTTNSATAPPARFSNAVGSAAANASSQAGAASSISGSSAVVLAVFSCLLSLSL